MSPEVMQPELQAERAPLPTREAAQPVSTSLEPVRVLLAEDEAVPVSVSAAQTRHLRLADEFPPGGRVLPGRAVAEHARARQDRRVAVAPDLGAAGRVEVVGVSPVEIASPRFRRPRPQTAADFAAQPAGAEVAHVDAADVARRRPEL